MKKIIKLTALTVSIATGFAIVSCKNGDLYEEAFKETKVEVLYDKTNSYYSDDGLQWDQDALPLFSTYFKNLKTDPYDKQRLTIKGESLDGWSQIRLVLNDDWSKESFESYKLYDGDNKELSWIENAQDTYGAQNLPSELHIIPDTKLIELLQKSKLSLVGSGYKVTEVSITYVPDGSEKAVEAAVNANIDFSKGTVSATVSGGDIISAIDDADEVISVLKIKQGTGWTHTKYIKYSGAVDLSEYATVTITYKTGADTEWQVLVLTDSEGNMAKLGFAQNGVANTNGEFTTVTLDVPDNAIAGLDGNFLKDYEADDEKYSKFKKADLSKIVSLSFNDCFSADIYIKSITFNK